VDITYTNVGTVLTSLPYSANSTLLEVVPEVSTVKSVDHKTLAGLVTEANVYAIRRSNPGADSQRQYARDGRIDERYHIKAAPRCGLGDLPGCELIFRSNSKDRKNQTIIFVTPTFDDEDSSD